jgi:hypothetical protein
MLLINIKQIILIVFMLSFAVKNNGIQLAAVHKDTFPFSISLADITPSKSKIVCRDFTFNRKNILMRLTIKIGR